MKKVTIYTDGSCYPNPGGPGGYAAILSYGKHVKEISGSELSSTNNRMEMMAVIAGLEALRQVVAVTVYTDSKYVRNAFTKGWLEKWKKNGWKTADNKPVKNKDLWQQLSKLFVKFNFKIKWVPGHVGIRKNERADELAREARYAVGR